MALRKRGLLVGLLFTIMMLMSFSQPASDNHGLVVLPEAVVLGEPRSDFHAPAVQGPSGPLQLTLRATAYNSLPSQTDSDPHITATGATTRFGIVAVSRDLLGDALPYGSLVRIRDLGSFGSGRGVGAFQELLDGHDLFIVEDTMHIRKTQQLDVWFPELSTALSWGVRQVEVEVIRHGRDGLVLDPYIRALDALPAFAGN